MTGLRHLMRVARSIFTLCLTALIRWVPWIARAAGLPTGIIWDFPGWVETSDRRRPWVHRGWHHSFQVVRPPQLVQSPLPITAGANIRHMYDESRFYQYPALGVGHLRGGRIATQHGVVMEPNGGVLEDFNYYWNRKPEWMPIFTRLQLPPEQRKTGVFATILSPDTAKPNFYHWVAEALPRIGILEESGLSFDQLIVPVNMTDWQADSLRLLGYSKERLAVFGEEQWRMEHLLVPTLVGFPGMCHPWLAGWLRTRMGIERRGPGRRKLYISRANAQYRRIRNEKEVISALERQGFETVLPETLSFEEQLRLFGDAEWIVSVHGAGLANVMFAPRGTRVLEFITAEPEYISTSFYSICCALGHAYGNLSYGYPEPRVPPIQELRRREDVVLPVGEMMKALRLVERAE